MTASSPPKAPTARPAAVLFTGAAFTEACEHLAGLQERAGDVDAGVRVPAQTSADARHRPRHGPVEPLGA
jgi:hypothetical protein